MEKNLYNFEIDISFSRKKNFFSSLKNTCLVYDNGLVYKNYDSIANHYIKTFYNVKYNNSICDDFPIGQRTHYIGFSFSSFEEFYATFYRLYKNNELTEIDFYVGDDGKYVKFYHNNTSYIIDENNYKYFLIYFVFYEEPKNNFSFFELMTKLNYSDFLDFMSDSNIIKTNKNVL